MFVLGKGGGGGRPVCTDLCLLKRLASVGVLEHVQTAGKTKPTWGAGWGAVREAPSD